jgi:hypothetical protein
MCARQAVAGLGPRRRRRAWGFRECARQAVAGLGPRRRRRAWGFWNRALVLAVFLVVGQVNGPAAAQALRIGAPAPEVAGDRWINGGPLTMQGLRGRVVLVEFWTFG